MIAPEIFYWKPKAEAVEVDFVIMSNNRIVGVEVKSTDHLNFSDTRSMREFLKTHPERSSGVIVYTGHKVYPVASNILAVPWTVF